MISKHRNWTVEICDQKYHCMRNFIGVIRPITNVFIGEDHSLYTSMDSIIEHNLNQKSMLDSEEILSHQLSNVLLPGSLIKIDLI